MRFGGVAFGAEGVEAGDLGALDFGFDAQGGDGAGFFGDEIVDADDDLVFGFDGALEIVGGFLNFALDEAGFDGAEHSSHGINPGDVIGGALLDFVGEVFDGVGAGDGIGCVGDASFVGEDLLGAQGDEHGILGGKGECFVHRIGVERLAAAEGGGEGLDGDADDIVFGLLGGQGGAGGLRVEAEEERARIFCAETVAHEFGPEAASGAVLGDFFEEVAVGVEEKESWGANSSTARPASSAAWT